MPTDIYSLTIEPSGELSLTLSGQGVAIPATHASTHGSGSTDPITIANTQVTGLGTMSTQNANNVAITAGTIAGVTISTSTLSSPTINTPVISGGTINSAVIGGTTPAAGTFTAVTGTTGTFSGAISGTTGTFTGNTSITGTLIVTGAVTLNTDLTVSNGGTGVSTITGIVKGNGTSAMSAVTSSTVGQVLRCTGTDSFAFGEVNLADTDAVTGTLPVARGGTGATSESAARIALDVPATNSTIRWRSDITAYTGGTSNALDSIDISNTTTWPEGSCVAFAVSGALVQYKLTTSAASEASPGIIRPDSYGGKLWVQILADSQVEGIVFVDAADKFPAASGGIRTLAANTTYFVTQDIDLAGDRLVASSDTAIVGTSSETASLTSTGLSAASALISSGWTMPLRDIAITHDIAVALDATGNGTQALDWRAVNFIDCPTVGTIKNYDNVILETCAFLNSSGLTLDGTINTFAADNTLFNTSSAGTAITVPATATIGRRFRIVYSSFVVLSGETGIDVNTSAVVPSESFILDTVNFSGGGDYIDATGKQYTDDDAWFLNCKGIANSTAAGSCYMTANATVTDIVTQNVAVKVAGTTTAASVNQKFTHTNNRLTYSGAISRFFSVTVTSSIVGAVNAQHSTYVYKGGVVVPESIGSGTTTSAGDAENITSQCVVYLETGDYVEVFIENNDNTTDVTVESLNMMIVPLN